MPRIPGFKAGNHISKSNSVEGTPQFACELSFEDPGLSPRLLWPAMSLQNLPSIFDSDRT